MTPAAEERAVAASLYPTTSRRPMAAGINRPGGAGTPRATTTREEPRMATSTVHPETARRRRLIAAAGDETLHALIAKGGQDDAAMARTELFLRGSAGAFTVGDRVRSRLTPAGTRWAGTVIDLGGSADFPIRVRWDHMGIETCSADELEFITPPPDNVVAFTRALGDDR